VERIVNGTPALSAALGSGRSPLHIALSPTDQLYISTGWRPGDAGQILRLTATGTLDVVRGVIPTGRDRGLPLGGASPIAVDGAGNVDVGGGPGGWAVWQVAPSGLAHLASGAQFAHGNGGLPPILQPGPGGSIYAACPGIFRVEPHKLVSIAAINGPLSRLLGGEAFTPLNFAFSPGGRLYADDEPGGGAFDAHQRLWSVSAGHVSVLWQETNQTGR
jgi:hypothetical protein